VDGEGLEPPTLSV